MKYEVISEFADLQDKKHVYSVGDEYPRAGYSPGEERVAELSSCANLQHKPLIRRVAEETEAAAEIADPQEQAEETPKRKRSKKAEK